jgi:hypothetical protein
LSEPEGAENIQRPGVWKDLGMDRKKNGCSSDLHPKAESYRTNPFDYTFVCVHIHELLEADPP